MTKKMPDDGSMVFPVKTSRVDVDHPVLDGVRHGTASAYGAGCRCDACRAAKAEGNRRYRQKAKHPNGGAFAAGNEKADAEPVGSSDDVVGKRGESPDATTASDARPGTVAYLAGPITGIADYRERFAEAASAVESAAGWTVLQPAWLPDGLSYEQAMRIDAAMIAESDVVVLLPGWRESPGTLREMADAIEAGKPVTSLASVAGGGR